MTSDSIAVEGLNYFDHEFVDTQVAIGHLLFAQVVCWRRGHSRISSVEISNDFGMLVCREFWDSPIFWDSSGTVMRIQFTTALKYWEFQSGRSAA